MAAEQLETWELYDPEQVRRVVENVEDPETKAILGDCTDCNGDCLSSRLSPGALHCNSLGDQIGSISKKYATKRLKALKCQGSLVAIFEKLVANVHRVVEI